MTADKQLPIYIVSGINWGVEIQLDEDDSELAPPEQALEAAAKAMEVFFGIREWHKDAEEEGDLIRHEVLQITDNEEPTTGAFLAVCLKGEEPEKNTLFIPAHIALADAGFYNESLEIQFIIESEMAALDKEEKKRRRLLKKKKAPKPPKNP